MLPLSAAVDSASVCSMAKKTKVYCCMIHGLFVAGQPHFSDWPRWLALALRWGCNSRFVEPRVNAQGQLRGDGHEAMGLGVENLWTRHTKNGKDLKGKSNR